MKYPTDSPRTQKKILEYKSYKCNEFHNMLNYLIIFIFKPAMKKVYFEHLSKFVLFIRILTQENISIDDIEFSQVLINEFASDFRLHYGKKSMSFNLHSFSHLPNQVKRKGPLHLINCFPFEGYFKVTKSYPNGTRNVAGQVAQQIELNQAIYFRDDQIKFNLCKIEVRDFVNKYSFGVLPKPSIPFNIKQFKSLSSLEKRLLNNTLCFSDNEIVNYTYACNINNKSKRIF